jgi:hypothetical protein
VALALAGTMAASSAVSAAPMSAGPRILPMSKSHPRTKLCSVDDYKWTGLHGKYVLYNDVLNSDDRQCITNIRSQPNFRIANSTTPQFAWNGYPNLFIGCHYRICSKSGGVPVEVSSLTKLKMTLWTRMPNGLGDDATDFWFTKHKPFKTSGHPRGAEMMLWLTWHGVPLHDCRKVPRFDHWRWCVEEWRTFLRAKPAVTWNYIQFRWLGHHRHSSISHLNLLPFIHYAELRGWIHRWWWASSFNAGFEIIKGGVGDRILKYQIIADH